MQIQSYITVALENLAYSMHITINTIQHTDINECMASSSPCGQICSNTEGSFECSCNNGYELDDDQRTCIGKLTIRMYL